MVGRVFSIKFATGDTTRCAWKNAPVPALTEYIGGAENSLVPVALENVFQERPKFNPIVFFGPTGTGKSLLVQLIVTRWKRDNRAARMVLTTGADFAREYAHAVETDSVADLRLKYRRAGMSSSTICTRSAIKRLPKTNLAGPWMPCSSVTSG